MICFTGYGVIDEKPRVGHLGHFFRAPVGKTLRRIKKVIYTFLMVLTSSFTMQSLWKIVQRAPAVGAKMSCLYVLWRCSFEGGIIWRSIVSWFTGRFWCSLQVIFRNRLPFQRVLIFVDRLRHNFRKIAVKIVKSPKISGKVYAHNFV